jgi:glycerate dehydrogenase
MRIVVLDAFAADQGQLSWEALGELGHVEVYPRTKPEELLQRAEGAAALLTNKVVIDAPLIEALPDLRYVGVVATGTNVVDLDACRAREIAVTNVPGYSTHSVAQLVFAFVLHFTHGVALHDARVKRGDWATSQDFMFTAQPLTELAGRTITIVGMGAIGRAVRDIAHAFGMNVMAASVPGSSTPGRAPLEDALPKSDVVSLHCPLTPQTKHLVGSAFLNLMKPGAILVNTGRGPLVDTAALRAALEAGRIGGVALDVLDEEPPAADHPLLPRAGDEAPWSSRLVVTPHIGWATTAARERLVAAVVENLAAFARGERRNRVD